MKFNVIVAIVFLVLNTLPVLAMERFEIITTEQLEQMLIARKTGKTDFVLMNALDEIIYNNTSIPESINVPWSRINQTIDRLGDDKSKLVVTY